MGKRMGFRGKRREEKSLTSPKCIQHTREKKHTQQQHNHFIVTIKTLISLSLPFRITFTVGESIGGGGASVSSASHWLEQSVFVGSACSSCWPSVNGLLSLAVSLVGVSSVSWLQPSSRSRNINCLRVSTEDRRNKVTGRKDRKKEQNRERMKLICSFLPTLTIKHGSQE